MSTNSDKKEYRLPRCLIASAGSGGGKTMICCGLIKVLEKRGFDVRPFKCGPDYIDPMYHRAVTGKEAVNLDTFLAGESGVRGLVTEAARTERDYKACAVMEGVMGIYDGKSPASYEGSSYEIAAITDTPVILVLDASGKGRTILSLLKGILADDDRKLIRGLIFNRMSEGSYESLYPVAQDEIQKTGRDIHIIGHIPSDKALKVGSRHLGLVMPGETEDIMSGVGRMASLIEDKCDLDMVESIMEGAPALTLSEDDKESAWPQKTVKITGDKTVSLAVARDEAFCFYYHENLKAFEDLGVRIVYFSPLNDSKVPGGASGILLGGGYPELHLAGLSENRSMLSSIRDAINGGMPSLAECGGFMYLHDVVCDTKGKEYPLCGLVGGRCTYSGHLVNFGYTMIESCKEESFTGLKGHEFHYYESSAGAEDAHLVKASGKREYEDMIAQKGRLWGFPHFYYPSASRAVAEFVKEMRRYAENT